MWNYIEKLYSWEQCSSIILSILSTNLLLTLDNSMYQILFQRCDLPCDLCHFNPFNIIIFYNFSWSARRKLMTNEHFELTHVCCNTPLTWFLPSTRVNDLLQLHHSVSAVFREMEKLCWPVSAASVTPLIDSELLNGEYRVRDYWNWVDGLMVIFVDLRV